MRKTFVVILAGLVLVLFSAGLISGVVLRYERIYPGVRMAGMDLGGLSKSEAQARLATMSAEFGNKTIRLNTGTRSYPVILRDIGVSVNVTDSVARAYFVGRHGDLFERLSDILACWKRGLDLPLVYAFDKGVLLKRLEKIAVELDREAVDAQVLYRDGVVRIRPDTPGCRLEKEASASSIIQAVNTGRDEVALRVKTLRPSITAADLRGVDGLLASYSTPTAGSARSRLHNLRLACKAIDGCLVKPGEVFSYNSRVGPRLPKKGFMFAPVFVEGEVRQGPGGGVCQVSTTLYNAALLAGLKIRQRSHHSMPVHYVPPGRDATVEYGRIDLKFENATGAPVYISAEVVSGRVVVNLFGKKTGNRQVEIETRGYSVIPYRVIERLDDGLAPGERVERKAGRVGYRVKVYRVVKQAGIVIDRELVSNDYYAPSDRVVAVGPPVRTDATTGN